MLKFHKIQTKKANGTHFIGQTVINYSIQHVYSIQCTFNPNGNLFSLSLSLSLSLSYQNSLFKPLSTRSNALIPLKQQYIDHSGKKHNIYQKKTKIIMITLHQWTYIYVNHMYIINTRQRDMVHDTSSNSWTINP